MSTWSRDCPTWLALVRRLDADWLDTCHRHDGLARVWARRSANLRGCEQLDDVVQLCLEGSDAAMLDLLTLARTGCPVAGQCVLRVLLPGLRRLARRDPDCDLDEYLGACWPVAMEYDASHRVNVLGNLVLDTRKALHRERTRVLLRGLPDEPPDPPAEQGAPSARGVVELARASRLVPRESVAVLDSVYLQGMSGSEAARRHATTPEMIRYRCASAIKALRSHRDVLLDAA